jgi:hypothetical protein
MSTMPQIAERYFEHDEAIAHAIIYGYLHAATDSLTIEQEAIEAKAWADWVNKCLEISDYNKFITKNLLQ